MRLYESLEAEWICAGDVRKPPGALTYTQMLNGRGGIECDLTVARLADDRFYLVTGTGFATHDFDWITRHLPAGADAALTDVTERFAVLALMGPRARDVLAAVTSDDVSNAALPFPSVREIRLAGHRVRALRVKSSARSASRPRSSNFAKELWSKSVTHSRVARCSSATCGNQLPRSNV